MGIKKGDSTKKSKRRFLVIENERGGAKGASDGDWGLAVSPPGSSVPAPSVQDSPGGRRTRGAFQCGFEDNFVRLCCLCLMLF